MSLQNIFYTRNSVLELGHVTNVTIFLKETAVSGWGSRYMVTLDSVRDLYYFFVDFSPLFHFNAILMAGIAHGARG